MQKQQEIPEPTEYNAEQQIEIDDTNTESQEKELLRFMMNYSKQTIEMEMLDEDGETSATQIPLVTFIVSELSRDKITFQNEAYQSVLEEYQNFSETDNIPDIQYFVNHSDPVISAAIIELLFHPYELSGNWKTKHRINVPTEVEHLKASAISYVYALKLRKVDKLITENLDEMKKAKSEEE